MARFAPLLALGLPLLLTACERLAPAPVADASAGQADLHELGRKVYNFRCYFCHGYSGDARTVAASQLLPPPRDFTRADGPTWERGKSPKRCATAGPGPR